MDNVASKYKRLAKDLFEVFERSMVDAGYAVSGKSYLVKEAGPTFWAPYSLRDIAEFNVGDAEMQEMVEFAVKNWERLRAHRDFKNLSNEPTFKDIISKWRIQGFMYAYRCGIDEFCNQLKITEQIVNKDVEEILLEAKKRKIVL